MNCHEIKEYLLENFGEKTIPAEVEQHIQTCAECREYHEELTRMLDDIGNDSTFYPNSDIVSQAVEAVDKQIDQSELKKSDASTPIWKTFVPVAAALIVVLGTAMVMQMIPGGDDGTTALSTGDTTIAMVDEIDITAIDVETVLETTSDPYLNYSGTVLSDDLTEEEYEYLAENFDVGELL